MDKAVLTHILFAGALEGGLGIRGFIPAACMQEPTLIPLEIILARLPSAKPREKSEISARGAQPLASKAGLCFV